MIANILAPHLPSFLQANPNTHLELEASTDISNLNVGASDIAVRMVKPAAETLVGRQLPAITLSLYCSAEYLRGREPAALTLSEECLMLYDSAYGPIAENVWAKSHGLNAAARLRSGSVQTLVQAALAGSGIALLPDFLARKTPLVMVPAPTSPTRNPWLVFHRDTRDQVSMKAVRNWIVDAFKHTLTPQPASNGPEAQAPKTPAPSIRKL